MLPAFDEIVKFTEGLNEIASFVRSIQFPHRVSAHLALGGKRSALFNNLVDARQQNKLQPLVERHGICEESSIRIIG